MKLLLALLLAPSAFASVPVGSYGGSSPLVKGGDVMALLLRRDPGNAKAGYAILSEYTRIPFIPGPERLEIARWVPRMYAFRVEEIIDGEYQLKPLRVSGSGGLEVDGGYSSFARLTLKKGSMIGATLLRFDKGSIIAAERIVFDGKVSSTWEDWVAGTFFGSRDATGGDYFKKDVNCVLAADKSADFFQTDVVGRFAATEQAPGMFVFEPSGAVAKGLDKIKGRIGVFVDIVNWKPFFTTNELLLINPDDARDVGFYYERH